MAQLDLMCVCVELFSTMFAYFDILNNALVGLLEDLVVSLLPSGKLT